MKQFKIYKTPDGKFYATKKSWFFGLYFTVKYYELVECFIEMGSYSKEWYRAEYDTHQELTAYLDRRYYTDEESKCVGYYEI